MCTITLKATCAWMPKLDVSALQSMMVDPVVAADGRTYERSALEAWLQQHQVSPVTGHHLLHTRLVPNVAARAALSNCHLGI